MKRISVVFIFALLIVIVGILGAVVLESKFFEMVESGSPIQGLHWILIGDLVCGGLIVFGLTLALGDMGIMASYFKKQITCVFTNLISDHKFLKKNLSPEIIKSLRKSSILALCKEPREGAYNPFFTLIEDDFLPMLDQAIRENHKIRYEQKILTINGKQMIDVTRTDQFTMKNFTQTPHNYVQRFKLLLDKIEDLPVFKKLEFEVNDKRVDLPYTVIEKDQVISYEGETTLVIEDSLKIYLRYNIVTPLEDRLAIWELYPTHKITFEYQHPPQFKPQLFLYGLSDVGPLLEPKHISEGKDFHEWEYDGWLLRKHGVLLTWKIR